MIYSLRWAREKHFDEFEIRSKNAKECKKNNSTNLNFKRNAGAGKFRLAIVLTLELWTLERLYPKQPSMSIALAWE